MSSMSLSLSRRKGSKRAAELLVKVENDNDEFSSTRAKRSGLGKYSLKVDKSSTKSSRSSRGSRGSKSSSRYSKSKSRVPEIDIEYDLGKTTDSKSRYAEVQIVTKCDPATGACEEPVDGVADQKVMNAKLLMELPPQVRQPTQKMVPLDEYGIDAVNIISLPSVGFDGPTRFIIPSPAVARKLLRHRPAMKNARDPAFRMALDGKWQWDAVQVSRLPSEAEYRKYLDDSVQQDKAKAAIDLILASVSGLEQAIRDSTTNEPRLRFMLPENVYVVLTSMAPNSLLVSASTVKPCVIDVFSFSQVGFGSRTVLVLNSANVASVSAANATSMFVSEILFSLVLRSDPPLKRDIVERFFQQNLNGVAAAPLHKVKVASVELPGLLNDRRVEGRLDLLDDNAADERIDSELVYNEVFGDAKKHKHRIRWIYTMVWDNDALVELCLPVKKSSTSGKYKPLLNEDEVKALKDKKHPTIEGVIEHYRVDKWKANVWDKLGDLPFHDRDVIPAVDVVTMHSPQLQFYVARDQFVQAILKPTTSQDIKDANVRMQSLLASNYNAMVSERNERQKAERAKLMQLAARNGPNAYVVLE